jgi:hypothetical protein
MTQKDVFFSVLKSRLCFYHQAGTCVDVAAVDQTSPGLFACGGRMDGLGVESNHQVHFTEHHRDFTNFSSNTSCTYGKGVLGHSSLLSNQV